MLEEFKNKTVKLIVRSDAGVSGVGGLMVTTSMIIVVGTLVEYDNEFVKIKNVQIMRNNVLEHRYGIAYDSDIKPRIDTYDVTLINKGKIITVSRINN